MRRILVALLSLSLLALPRAADAQLAPGCYNGMIGNGAAQGNVISTISAASAQSLFVTSGCTPVITLGPVIDGRDVTSIGTSANAIANAYITNLAIAKYAFSGTSALATGGYTLEPITGNGVTNGLPSSVAYFGVGGTNAGSTSYDMGANLVILPATANGTSGNSSIEYLCANTATAGTIFCSYINTNSVGQLQIHTGNSAGIALFNAPVNIGTSYVLDGEERNYAVCGHLGAPLASGSSINSTGTNCQGKLASGTYNVNTTTFATTTPPCVTATEAVAGSGSGVTLSTGTGTQGAILYSETISGSTYTITFTSTAGSADNNEFSFHIGGCPS